LTKILADSAWCISTGDTSVVIGIIDTGVQLDHPDLVANIWINSGEDGPDGLGGSKRTNGIDDDVNGKIDDWRGWDFGGADYNAPVEDNLPVPTESNNAHGTHVAGIAAASTNNGIGVAGIGNTCRIMAVKTTSDNDKRGSGGTPYVIFGFEGIVYAADMGADIINCSWGGTGGSLFEQDVITYATQHGSLVVAAAGNLNVTIPDFPAAYDGVLSVAATNSSDIKASYSKHGITIDLAAPGDNIYSTYYPNTYSSLYGTSMASPLVAGVAALVKSKNPSYAPQQVGEQVRVTADPIGTLNPSYLLGKGRLNAFRALSESSPSVRLQSFTMTDYAGGRANGIAEPGESLAVITTIKNFLSPTSPALRVALRTTSPYVTVFDSVFTPGTLGTLQEADNTSSPFRIRVGTSVPPASLVTLSLVAEDGAYADVEYITILINPTFATHDVNSVKVTLVNNGRVGFSDLTNSGGVGFVFGGLNHLYEGGLIVGTSSTKLLDEVRNGACQTCQDNDFASAGLYDMVTPGAISQQDGHAIFLDSIASATNKIGLRIEMSSYAFTGPADSNYVLIRYDIHNSSAATISNLYAGLFFDWDIQNYSANKTGYDQERKLGYAWDTTASSPMFVGNAAMDSTVVFCGLANAGTLAIDRAAKWTWISGGISQDVARGDIHTVISSGPLTIPANGGRTIGFALSGGASLASLQASTDAAREKWLIINPPTGVGEDGNEIPGGFQLYQNYPNPFNPSTVIRYDLPASGMVTLKVFDLLGREVGAPVQTVQQAGGHSVTIDASAYAAGVYFYRLTAGDRSQSRKFVVLK
jgi:hypothetical protein